MSKYWSRLTQSLEPYVPGEQPREKRYIKLNTNENPYPPSPKVIAALQAAANASLRLYPDPTGNRLKEVIAGYYHLNPEQVFVGNGSDEVLAFSFQAFFNPGETILFPDITYSFYKVYASLFQLDYQLVPLTEDFSIPLEKFCQENGGIILPNPNAPTAKGIALTDIKGILEQNPAVVVIIDEAYIDFGGQSAVELTHQYPNLLVVQTLSKSRSLAGLRVGFALGQTELIAGLERVKNSFNSYTLDGLALAGACEAIKDEAYFEVTRARIMQTRERVSRELIELDFNVLPSQANFIFISHSQYSAPALFAQLREKGILVRYFQQPRIDNYLRVSIGSDEEMDSFLTVVKEIIQP